MLYATLIVVVLAVGWRLDVYLHPFARCRRCGGSGWNWGSRSTAYGLCRHGLRRVRFTGRRSADRHIARQRRP